ncbi:acyl transferase/acyl hydrolase/lysophospholipase [Catenaria anguillulae PL171]|uniref:[acyl-carrier-protein] S-malonyltransferase n=1 Tax=Catenaria anguillulae PL171 TaxID=765915 RepID=A0A1Y2HJC0_9FUNG|nr:acyl transferase/acyl hydrolase/lysophospholipase [Catenaria anguillulae PL171]
MNRITSSIARRLPHGQSNPAFAQPVAQLSRSRRRPFSFVGMSKQLVADFPTAARPILDHVDHILGFNLSKIMFDGPAEVLTSTSHAQPAILASSAALLAVLKHETGFEVTEHADYVLGHSLGEYTALYATGALTFGRPLSLCGLDALANHIRTVVHPSLGPNEVVDLSNINSSTQAVLSGTHDAIERTCKHAVSAPFHCRLMKAAADAMRPHLDATQFKMPKVPVISNVTVAPIASPDEIPGLLYQQITGTVKWQPSIQYLRERGRVRDWAVVGPNRVLGNLLRKDWPTDRVVIVEEGEEIKAVDLVEQVVPYPY